MSLGFTAEDYLERFKNIATSHGVSKLAETVLDNPKFVLWSGSSKPHQHHYGKGQLIAHTFEVALIAATTNHELKYGVDPAKLFLSCLFHDSGKMWDYEPKYFDMVDNGVTTRIDSKTDYSQWSGTDHKRKIYHIQRSFLVWNEAAKANNLSEEYTDEVGHAILAHHGMPDWGSPVGPNTKLAWLVHLADNISARMYDCDTWDITRQ